VELTYTRNASNPDEKFVLHEKEFTLQGNLSYYLPVPNRENEWGTKKRDLPTETVWKIFNFAHFYCAKYFKLTPADHSTMLTLFDVMLNKEIQYRWYDIWIIRAIWLLKRLRKCESQLKIIWILGRTLGIDRMKFGLIFLAVSTWIDLP